MFESDANVHRTESRTVPAEGPLWSFSHPILLWVHVWSRGLESCYHLPSPLISAKALARAGPNLEESSLGWWRHKILLCSCPPLPSVSGFRSFWDYGVALWLWKTAPLVSLAPWSSYKSSCSWGMLRTRLPTHHSLPLSSSPCCCCCCSCGAWGLLELCYSSCGNVSICRIWVRKERWKPQLDMEGTGAVYQRETLLQSSWQAKWLFDRDDLQEANIFTSISHKIAMYWKSVRREWNA